MKLFTRFFGTDEEKVALDRRLFLKGATVTAAGLILPLPIISIPPVIAVAEIPLPVGPLGVSGATGPMWLGWTSAYYPASYQAEGGLWIPVGPTEPGKG